MDLIFKEIYDNFKALGVLKANIDQNVWNKLDVINDTNGSLSKEESDYNKIVSLLYPTNDSNKIYSTLGEILNARKDKADILEHFSKLE